MFPRNILITKFPYSSTFGGGEKHTLTLVEQLQQRGFQFYLLSTCTTLVPEFKKRGWSVQRIWAGTEPVTPMALMKFFIIAPFVWLNLMRWLLWYKKYQQIERLICLSLTEKILLTPWAKLLGMQVFWMEHLQIERWLLASPLRYLYIFWSRYATVVTVVEAVKQQLIALGVSNEHIQVIYNSVDLSEFVSQPALPIQDRFELMFIGRLAQEKGIDDLIQAVRQLTSTIPQLHLTILGQGYWRADLEALTVKLQLQSHVHFLGFQEQVMGWLQRSHVLVLPATRRETFGIVLAEALALEKPVVATTVGGLPEVVGDNGWLVPPHQPIALAQAIREIYQAYPVAVAKAKLGRQRVVDLFAEDRMIEAYAQLLA